MLNTRKAGNVVFSATEVGKNGATKIFGGKEAQKFARATVGNGLLPEGSSAHCGGCPYEIDGLKTLSVATVERVTGKPVDRTGWPATAPGSTTRGRPVTSVRVVLPRRQGTFKPGRSATRSS